MSNLETEHGITIKGSRSPTVRKSSPVSSTVSSTNGYSLPSYMNSKH